MKLNSVIPAALAGILVLALTPAASAKSTVHTIVIEGMQFSPADVEVSTGDTVIWKNKDLVPHNATADDRSFASPEIAPNSSWQFIARKKASYPYTCTLHPTMKARLVVK
jgi:plastocyanin